MPEGEYLIDGRIFVNTFRAAELRGLKRNSVGFYVQTEKWERRNPLPELGLHKLAMLYLKDDVLRRMTRDIEKLRQRKPAM